MSKRLILLGPPGSGKGTQAKLLCDRLDMVHVATGDIMREAVRRTTALGKQVKPFMDAGKYVPDVMVNGLIAERFHRKDRPIHFLMDGYPRTLDQASAFDEVLKQESLELDAVVYLDVPDDEIVRRVSGRRVCPHDGSLYHVTFTPPKQEGVCDECGGELQQRADDQEETVRERLRVFRETLPPVMEHYRRRGIYREVKGEGDVNDIQQSILCNLGMKDQRC